MEPAGQIMHVLGSVWPKVGLAVPAGQLTHAALLAAPIIVLKVPLGHGVYVCRRLAAFVALQ